MTKEEIKNQIAADINPEELTVRTEEIKEDPEEGKAPGISEELPMLADGMIDAAALSGGVVDGKGRYVLKREIIEKYYKLLPDGCISEDRQVWTANNGLLHMPSKEVCSMGANALNATKARRRTFKEAIDIALRNEACRRDLEEVGLEKGATNLDVIVAAALKQSARGNVKAMDFLRDTAGEKPAEQLNADISGLSEEDKQMIENIRKRLEGD